MLSKRIHSVHSGSTAVKKYEERKHEDSENDELPKQSKHRNKSTNASGLRREDQLTYYTGDLRITIDIGCALFRVYLATVNAFPTALDLIDLPRKFFEMACKHVKKSNSVVSKSLYICLARLKIDIVLVTVEDMTNGIEKLVSHIPFLSFRPVHRKLTVSHHHHSFVTNAGSFVGDSNKLLDHGFKNFIKSV